MKITTNNLVESAVEHIRNSSGIQDTEFAIVIGSGWQGAPEMLGKMRWDTDSSKVPGFNGANVPGHAGKVSIRTLPSGRNILVLQARTHLYEDVGVASVVHGVRVAAKMGAKIMVLTNGAGGIKESWKPGTPVLISDHINLTASSPLEGATFIDLTDLYSRRLRDIAQTVDSGLDEGVYVQFRGPHYETPAEVQMAKTMGGHIVGMSTALEAIAAREAGMEVLGLSLITNLAAGISPHPLSHTEVIDAGKAAEPVISKLLADIVSKL